MVTCPTPNVDPWVVTMVNMAAPYTTFAEVSNTTDATLKMIKTVTGNPEQQFIEFSTYPISGDYEL